MVIDSEKKPDIYDPEEIEPKIEPFIETKEPIPKKPLPKGFHFVFNIDCKSHRKTHHYMAFTLFYSFLSMYDEFSGNTMTELISCPDLSFKPAWAGKLPSHCRTVTVQDFESHKEFPFWDQGYLPYNKPTALRFLLEGVWKEGSSTGPKEDDIIVIIDPDFTFLRPLSRVFLDITSEQVINGHYDIGNWQNYIKRYQNITCAPCEKITKEESVGFEAGVPNIMHLSTLRKVVQPWIDYTYYFHTQNDWQDEQFGYIYAIANLSLKSSVENSFFVSSNEIGDYVPFTFLHYCQSYFLDGNWKFSKHEIMIDSSNTIKPPYKPVFSCDSKPVLIPRRINGEATNAFAYIAITRYLHGAAKYWRQLFCGGEVVI